MGGTPQSATSVGMPDRLARLFASPGAVLVILPALVISAGVIVLLLGRNATRETAENMARHQLVAQAEGVQHDVEFALDQQATPVLAMLRTLADAAMPTPDALLRLHDIVVGRPGITNTSITFPVGVTWGTFKDRKTGELGVDESRVEATLTTRTDYRVHDGKLEVIGTATSSYDGRTRPHYVEAMDAKQRVWTPPRVFSSSGRTGMTVSEPVYTPQGGLAAVLALDFDVAELSDFIRKPALAGARNVLFTADGTILAFPSAAIPDIATKEKRLLRHEDFHDPALEALFATIGNAPTEQHRFLHVDASDGRYLASVAVVRRQQVHDARLPDWYLATLVPEATLFGSTQRLGRDALIASGAALAIALGIAVMFAWNILRMRRAVTVAREAARSAEERAKHLGSYRLVEQIGAGGMGEVWRAEHQLLARKAAIKLVRADVLRSNPERAALIQERFRREAQTLASMRSRHTIELYDYGVTEDGTFFYVMELLDGLDLQQLVRGYGAQPAARVIRILVQACQSLAEAHDAGLLHRDIKPANLVLCRAADELDIIKLLDFGIVHNLTDPIDPASVVEIAKPKPTERLTREGNVIGTPGYIPPEQASATHIDQRGDLYALGCVAWHLLTGAEVYPGKTDQEVLRKHVFEPVPALHEHARGWLPVRLEELITECLAKHPSERPPDARTLAKQLAAIVIPDEHAWTSEDTEAWWASLRKPSPASADRETARVVVPQRGDLPENPSRTIETRMA